MRDQDCRGQRRENPLWPGASREGFLEEVKTGPRGVDLAGDNEGPK